MHSVWKHYFVCLTMARPNSLPMHERDLSSLRQKLSSWYPVQYIYTFPKLASGGGFQLYKCASNLCDLKLLSKLAHTQIWMNVWTFIVPLLKLSSSMDAACYLMHTTISRTSHLLAEAEAQIKGTGKHLTSFRLCLHVSLLILCEKWAQFMCFLKIEEICLSCVKAL